MLQNIALNVHKHFAAAVEKKGRSWQVHKGQLELLAPRKV